jgi:hypothetical protein
MHRYCQTKKDCEADYGTLYECKYFGSLGGNFCSYKNLWPLSWQDGVGSIALLVGCALAAGGGLGGGGIIVPVLVLLFEFPARQAVAISNVSFH